MAEAWCSLLQDYRAKLRLQESRYCKRHDHLKSKVVVLKRRLDQEERRRQAAMDAQAAAEAELSFLYKQVKGVASLAEKASDVADRARGL